VSPMSQTGRADISRKLISLSRTGGISLKDQFAKKEPNKGGKSAPKETKMGKSASEPMMNTKSSNRQGSKRMGGGWSRPEMPEQYRELLSEVGNLGLSLDFCEKPYHRTALWEATWKNHEGIVKLLATKGANIAAPDFQGGTPLHEAAYYGHSNLVDFFIDKGHSINCVDSFGQTPLFRASEAGRGEVCKILLERGANANLVDNDKCTAQHLSAFQGRPRLAEYLRFNGAFRNRYGDEFSKTRSEPSGSIKSGAALALTPSPSGKTIKPGFLATPSRKVLRAINL